MINRHGSGCFTEAEIISADPEWILDQLNKQGIDIYGVYRCDELRIRFSVAHIYTEQLRLACERHGDTFRVVSRFGVWNRIANAFKRPVLVAGFILLFALTCYSPTRILFISVEGNQALSETEIIMAAESCGIRFGARREQVRSEAVKNMLLDKIPQLQWAGINTYGCRAVISVSERSTAESHRSGTSGICHIIAALDGVLTQITVTKGTPLCAIGDAVTQGQVLVSGYTDCVFFLRAEQAEAEIYGNTYRNMKMISVNMQERTTESLGSKTYVSILIGKKRINLWKDSGIFTTSCDRMYKEYYLTLPGGFQLPVGFAVERIMEHRMADVSMPADPDAMEDYARNYLHSRMIAGRILREQPLFREEQEYISLDMRYECTELIGIPYYEKIGDTNE